MADKHPPVVSPTLDALRARTTPDPSVPTVQRKRASAAALLEMPAVLGEAPASTAPSDLSAGALDTLSTLDTARAPSTGSTFFEAPVQRTVVTGEADSTVPTRTAPPPGTSEGSNRALDAAETGAVGTMLDALVADSALGLLSQGASLPAPLMTQFGGLAGSLRFMFLALPSLPVEEVFAPLIDYVVKSVPERFPQAAPHAQAVLFDLMARRADEALAASGATPKLREHKNASESADWHIELDRSYHKIQVSQLELLKVRLRGLREAYASFDAQTASTQLPEQTDVTDPERQRIVGLALGEVGRTDYGNAGSATHVLTDVGPTGKPARPGWERVRAYFRGAGIPASHISNESLAYELHGKSWCAIFVVWAARQTAYATRAWNLSGGKDALWEGANPLQVGDIVANSQSPENHHGVVVGLERDADGRVKTVHTVEGNIDGGRVVRKTRGIAEWPDRYALDKPLG